LLADEQPAAHLAVHHDDEAAGKLRLDVARVVVAPPARDLRLAQDGEQRLDVAFVRFAKLQPLAAEHYISRRPASARPSVTSSAYSRSPPTGSPLARRVTRARPRRRSAR